MVTETSMKNMLELSARIMCEPLKHFFFKNRGEKVKNYHTYLLHINCPSFQIQMFSILTFNMRENGWIPKVDLNGRRKR